MAENSPPHLYKERKGRNSPATKLYVMQVSFSEILLSVHLPLGIVVTILAKPRRQLVKKW